MSGPGDAAVRDAHFPGRAPIDAYGRGGFRFAGMSHQGAILCLPSGIHGWKVTTFAALQPRDFDAAVAEAAEFELLLIGTGATLAAAPEWLRWRLKEVGLRLEALDTGAAVRTYNILLAEDRPVGAALLPVD
jgi:uncharacterized protein